MKIKYSETVCGQKHCPLGSCPLYRIMDKNEHILSFGYCFKRHKIQIRSHVTTLSRETDHDRDDDDSINRRFRTILNNYKKTKKRPKGFS